MGKQLIIEGGKSLNGTLNIDGSKNAALALICASLLSKNVVTLTNVPRISDVFDMLDILNILNVKYEFINNTLVLDSKNIINKPLITDTIKKIRASYYFMGTLLALFQEVNIASPGGCKIGERPIDYHLNGFRKMGIDIEVNDNIYSLKYSILNNCTIVLPFPSVGTTINLLLAASKGYSVTVIDNISCEPEVIQVIDLLKKMGAKIKLIGERTLIVIGCEFNKSIEFNVIQDRIEAGTYCILGALLGDNLTIKGIEKKHLNCLFKIFKEININYQIKKDSITFFKSHLKNSLDVTTSPYPLFPTDLQQPLCVLATQLPNISYIFEGIYFDRKSHIIELNKMGAKINSFQNKIIINGKTTLYGTKIIASDLRGGAALIIAALIANGTSSIDGVNYIERGYPNFIEKLTNIGANIKLEEN